MIYMYNHNIHFDKQCDFETYKYLPPKGIILINYSNISYSSGDFYVIFLPNCCVPRNISSDYITLYENICFIRNKTIQSVGIIKPNDISKQLMFNINSHVSFNYINYLYVYYLFPIEIKNSITKSFYELINYNFILVKKIYKNYFIKNIKNKMYLFLLYNNTDVTNYKHKTISTIKKINNYKYNKMFNYVLYQ